MFTLIVPIAGDNPEYNQRMPLAFTQDDKGIMYCVRSILGLPLDVFSQIYFVILKKHDEHYSLRERIEIQFKINNLPKANVLVLDAPTLNQPHTVHEAIVKAGISGSIFVKDPDGFFVAEEIFQQNGVAIFPLEELSLVDPQHKSYVTVDDMNYITNIIERRVVSNKFNAGGYCFEWADEYCRYYERLKNYGKLYLSHIIYAMLLDKISFRPIDIKNYQDWSINNI